MSYRQSPLQTHPLLHEFLALTAFMLPGVSQQKDISSYAIIVLCRILDIYICDLTLPEHFVGKFICIFLSQKKLSV